MDTTSLCVDEMLNKLTAAALYFANICWASMLVRLRSERFETEMLDTHRNAWSCDHYICGLLRTAIVLTHCAWEISFEHITVVDRRERTLLTAQTLQRKWTRQKLQFISNSNTITEPSRRT